MLSRSWISSTSHFQCFRSPYTVSYASRKFVRCPTTFGFHGISFGILLHGNSLHKPQNCTPCSRTQVCILHLPDSFHSGTAPSASIQPGHSPDNFFLHSTQHSPQAVIVEKSVVVIKFPPCYFATAFKDVVRKSTILFSY